MRQGSGIIPQLAVSSGKSPASAGADDGGTHHMLPVHFFSLGGKIDGRPGMRGLNIYCGSIPQGLWGDELFSSRCRLTIPSGSCSGLT